MTGMDMGSRQGIRCVDQGFSIDGKMRIYVGSGTPASAFSAQESGDLYIDYTNAVLYIASAAGTANWTAYAGLSSLASGATFGGTSVFTGSGSPAGVTSAVRIADLYFDYTNMNVYIASATGTGGWVGLGGATVTQSIYNGSSIGGTYYFTGSGTPKGVVTPIRIGDCYTDYTNANDWIAIGTTNTSWVLTAMGIGSGTGIVQTYVGTISQAQAQAGVTLIVAQTGHTLTPIYAKFIINGTMGGSGTLTLQDTNSSPVNIMSATEAALAAAAGASKVLSTELSTLPSGFTLGAGMGAALTTAKGIAVPAAASLTTTVPIIVIIEYMVS